MRDAALAAIGEDGWIVGGHVRDLALGRDTDDVDVVVRGDVADAARRAARAGGAARFALSDEHGAWRVVSHDGGWQIDLSPLHGDTIEDDLARRDLTINAIARPLAGGPEVDPFGGRADLEARRLRMVSGAAFDADPLRVLRLVRLSVQLDFDIDDATATAARAAAGALAGVAAERCWAELRAILVGDRVGRGLDLLAQIGAAAVVLPELEALRGVRQSRFHHLDVYEHTRAVLDGVVGLQRDPAAVLGISGEPAGGVAGLLAEPLADGLTRGDALRLGALLHDIAKPATRDVRPDGHVTFVGHHERGVEIAGAVLTRLRAAERVRTHVQALVHEHLRLGFLVKHAPLDRAATLDYLRATGRVAADVTLLSVADRLATRGDDSDRAIARHMELARAVLVDALAWHRDGPPRPLLDGHELSRLTGAQGPALGERIADLVAAQFTGEVRDVEDARRWATAQRIG